MRFVSNWFSDPASSTVARHTFRSTFYILDDLGLDGYAVLVVAKGPSHVAMLVELAQAPEPCLSAAARRALDLLIAIFRMVSEQIKQLDAEIARRPGRRTMLAD